MGLGIAWEGAAEHMARGPGMWPNAGARSYVALGGCASAGHMKGAWRGIKMRGVAGVSVCGWDPSGVGKGRRWGRW